MRWWETDRESDREWFNIIMRVGETHSKNHRERLRDTVRERYHEWDRELFSIIRELFSIESFLASFSKHWFHSWRSHGESESIELNLLMIA